MRKIAIRIGLVAAVLVPAAVIAWWWWDYSAGETKTHTVARGDLLAGVTVSGSVRTRQKAAIAAEIVAVIRRLAVREGQVVKEGQVLVELDDRVVAAECVMAEARLELARQKLKELQAGPRKEEITGARRKVESAEADLAYARTEHEKLSRAIKSGAATRSELDLAINRLEVAKSHLGSEKAQLDLLLAGTRQEQIARGEAEVRLAEAQLSKCRVLREKHTLRSPHAGKIAVKYVNPGEVVSPGQVLLRVENTDAIEIEAHVQESQLAGAKKGGLARVLADAFPDNPLAAVVTEILPMVDPERGAITVKLELRDKPSFELTDGMAVDVVLIREHAKGVLCVPARAVHRRGGESFVWVRKGGSFARREITVGVSDGQWVEVKSGLNEDDVIRLPQDGSR